MIRILTKAPKLPKWAWLLLWFAGILASLFIIVLGSFQTWVSTWPEYKGEGFSFKYPKDWYVANYGFGPSVTNFLRFSPQPQSHNNVVDFGGVPFQGQVEVDNVTTSLGNKISKYNYIKLGANKFLFLESAHFDYLVVTQDKVYDVTGNSKSIRKLAIVSEKLQFIKGLLSALTFRF